MVPATARSAPTIYPTLTTASAMSESTDDGTVDSDDREGEDFAEEIVIESDSKWKI